MNGRILQWVQGGIGWQDPRLVREGGPSQHVTETENLQEGSPA